MDDESPNPCLVLVETLAIVWLYWFLCCVVGIVEGWMKGGREQTLSLSQFMSHGRPRTVMP